MRELRQGLAKDGSVYFAVSQTEGKGQRKKHWLSNPGENLIMSMVLDCSAYSLNDQFLLSAAVVLACHNLFASCAGDETCIKWPNDLFWRDRKAGGILIENNIKGAVWEHAVVGIGININQTHFPSMARMPVSLKQVTGKSEDPIALSQSLSTLIKERITMLGNNRDQLLKDYNDALYLSGKMARFQYKLQVIEGRVEGVTPSGLLRISNAAEQTFASGELTWLS